MVYPVTFVGLISYKGELDSVRSKQWRGLVVVVVEPFHLTHKMELTTQENDNMEKMDCMVNKNKQ